MVEKANLTACAAGWNTSPADGAPTAADTDGLANVTRQSGILAQPCCGQGTPSAICIIGVVTAVTVALASCAGATMIVASVRTNPKMPSILLILLSLPGSNPYHNTQFAER